MTALLVTYQLLIFAVFSYLYKGLIFSGNLIHISSFHFAYFFVFYFLGASELYVDGGLVNDRYFFSVTLYPIIVVLGMYTAKAESKCKVDYLVVKLKNFKYIFLFALVISILYALSLKEIPLSYILEGDAAGAAISRTDATKEYEGSKTVYYAFRVIVDYILIYLLIFIYVKYEKMTVLFIVSLIGALTISLFDFQKYPAINILVMLSMAVFLFNRAKLSTRMSLGTLVNFKVLLMLLCSYLVLGGLWAAAAGRLNDRDMFGIFESIIQAANSMVGDRLIFGENRPLYAVYQIVPARFDYFLGQTFPNPLRLLPFEPIQFSYIVYDAVHPGGEGVEGVRGAAPTAFFSVIYANFGIVVSFISMYLFGFLVQILNDKLLYLNKYVIPYRFVLLNYVTLFATSIDVFFLSEKVFLIVLLYFVMYRKIRKV